ncbi:universal stress protein [Arthrobacter sp. Soil762]|uniref:universal stress protein n=1 Tax=Arthrobacter sp. Soil762 TaxID=1736401 RepID=UPI0006F53FEF|nr:universal stress protein [Arthrobacter sp. Soil762]KRE80426.1 hypothetical protein ASG77_00150 [Arthrobacter sp. Soil762]
MDHLVVGYDGSSEAGPAVRWAARQASLRGGELHLVHCSLWPALTHDLGPVPGVADSGLRHAAEAIVAEGAGYAHAEVPGLTITTGLMYGWAAENLRKLSSGATMLVVGSRGLGGFMGLLVGSVSLELASTAACPVAIVRTGEHPNGPVVVGIDVEEWEPALRHACTLATLFETTLRVIHVRRSTESSTSPEQGLTPPMPGKCWMRRSAAPLTHYLASSSRNACWLALPSPEPC